MWTYQKVLWIQAVAQQLVWKGEQGGKKKRKLFSKRKDCKGSKAGSLCRQFSQLLLLLLLLLLFDSLFPL